MFSNSIGDPLILFFSLAKYINALQHLENCPKYNKITLVRQPDKVNIDMRLCISYLSISLLCYMQFSQIEHMKEKQNHKLIQKSENDNNVIE